MVVLEKCTEGTNPQVKILLECFQIICPDAYFGGSTTGKSKINSLTKPYVSSKTDLHTLAIFYPAKFLLFIGQINEAKIALAWSFADVKGGKYRKPNGKYV